MRVQSGQDLSSNFPTAYTLTCTELVYEYWNFAINTHHRPGRPHGTLQYQANSRVFGWSAWQKKTWHLALPTTVRIRVLLESLPLGFKLARVHVFPPR